MLGNRVDMTANDEAASINNTKSPLGDFLIAEAKEAFYGTSVSTLVNENKINMAEADEYGIGQSSFWSPNPFDPVTQNKQYREKEALRKSLPTLSKEDWEKSEYYRDGIKWEDGMTPVRASLYAQGVDDHNYRQRIIDGRDADIIDSALGFGIGMIASLPDPINFIPLGRALKIGGSAAAKIGTAALEGAVGNLATSAIARPYWDKRGIESDWKDYVMDAALGGALGGLFGTGGVALERIRSSRGKVTAEEATAIGRGIEAVIAGEDPSNVGGFQDAINSVRAKEGLDQISFEEEIRKPDVVSLDLSTADDPDGLVGHVSDEELASVDALAREGQLTDVEMSRLDEVANLDEAADKAAIAYKEAVNCVI